jgi:signal transduction histidine kinase
LPNLPLVSDRIRQVFLNILLNALDAMPRGGKLTAQTARTRKPEGVRVTIRDTGEGMMPEVLGRIFEPFYSTKKSGLGLGLFTSRSIIDWHEGAIEARSRPGHGSAFEVWLPAASPSRQARAPGRYADAAPGRISHDG